MTQDNTDWISDYQCSACKKQSNRRVLYTNPLGQQLKEPGTQGAPKILTFCCRAPIEKRAS